MELRLRIYPGMQTDKTINVSAPLHEITLKGLPIKEAQIAARAIAMTAFPGHDFATSVRA